MRKVRIFGPIYRDVVCRVDRALLEEGTIDGSFEGIAHDGNGLTQIVDESGGSLVIEAPPYQDFPQRGQHFEIKGRLREKEGPWTRVVTATSHSVSPGGMGAGFGAAFKGEVVSAFAVGPSRTDQLLIDELIRHGATPKPLFISGVESDWTWIISSGPFGDKLAIGFRGCHSSVTSLEPANLNEPCDLLVVAGFSNHLIAQALQVPAPVRMLAPAMRNMKETKHPLAALAGRFDYFACNQAEWKELKNSDSIREKTAVISITKGPEGADVLFRNPHGAQDLIQIPAFPRDRLPIDTNRAGEAFASSFLTTLLNDQWTPGPTKSNLIRKAALKASEAASKVLDIKEFGFPE